MKKLVVAILLIFTAVTATGAHVNVAEVVLHPGFDTLQLISVISRTKADVVLVNPAEVVAGDNLMARLSGALDMYSFFGRGGFTKCGEEGVLAFTKESMRSASNTIDQKHRLEIVIKKRKKAALRISVTDGTMEIRSVESGKKSCVREGRTKQYHSFELRTVKHRIKR